MPVQRARTATQSEDLHERREKEREREIGGRKRASGWERERAGKPAAL